jgi:hypothetical protein
MCGGPAKELVIIRSKEDLISIIKEYQSSVKPFKVVWRIIQHSFRRQQDFDGLMVINQSNEIIFRTTDEKSIVTLIRVQS